MYLCSLYCYVIIFIKKFSNIPLNKKNKPHEFLFILNYLKMFLIWFKKVTTQLSKLENVIIYRGISQQIHKYKKYNQNVFD